MKASRCDMVIVGVGGQGVILISDVIGRAAVLAGVPVRGAETHGMAQRGGSVINHTRLGTRLSPMVAPGRADILLALEPAEALRFGHYLKDGGVSLVNTSIVLPVTVTTGRFSYPDLQEILAPLRRKGEVKAIAATSLAKKAGTPMAMNVVMLGALSAYLPLEEDYLLSALRSVIPSKYLEMNLRAYHFGKAEVE